jgi:LPXTG-motif cell wall-anchored protein
VPYEGVQRLFRNRYEPIIPGTTTTLSICKTISFPEGYIAPETPDFTFKVTLDNETYGSESYTVIDNKTKEVVESGITEEDGTFRMKGGYTALFAEVPTNVEYRVEEIDIPENWKVTGDQVLEGEKTRAPETALYFNNMNTSFYVTKEMKPGEDIAEESFEFLLTKGKGESKYEWVGAKYYKYDTSTGHRVGDKVYETTDKGTFTLKARQAAVFIDVEPGTVYNVSEIANPDYKQETPNNASGYVDHEATDSIEELPFVNTAQKKKGMLTVTKKVESLKGDVVANENQEKDQFHFELYQVMDGSTGDTPVTGKSYSIIKGKDTETHDTDENGRFSIKANETAIFEDLPVGKYKVKEVELEEGYKIKTDSEGEVDQQGELETTNNLNFIFTNEYLADKINLELTKVNRAGDKTFSNISFELHKDEEVGEVMGTYTTDSEGKLLIHDLASGIYYLKELEAPTGYQILEAPIKIEITRSKDRREIQVMATVNDIGLKVDDENPSKEEEINNDIAKKVTRLELVKSETEEDQIKISVINDLLYSLPNSGESGIFLYILSGIVLMMAASYLYWRKVRLWQI